MKRRPSFATLLALLVLAKGASAEAPPQSPKMWAAYQIRSDVPLAHGVNGIGSLFGVSQQVGYWGPGFRIGTLLEGYLANDCRCSPFGSLSIAGLGGTVSVDLVDRPSWSLSADARYRFLAGLKNGNDYPGPVHSPGVGIAFWSKIPGEPARLHAGFRMAWSFELTTSYWLSPDQRSLAVGLGVGFVGGIPLTD